jgi:hypothetical protein
MTTVPIITDESIKEMRDNLFEARQSLQKGNLVETLEHLNFIDEQLLLVTSPAIKNK